MTATSEFVDVNSKPFPPMLAKTWLDIMSHTDDESVRNEIIARLTAQFGTIMNASRYVDDYFAKNK